MPVSAPCRPLARVARDDLWELAEEIDSQRALLSGNMQARSDVDFLLTLEDQDVGACMLAKAQAPGPPSSSATSYKPYQASLASLASTDCPSTSFTSAGPSLAADRRPSRTSSGCNLLAMGQRPSDASLDSTGMAEERRSQMSHAPAPCWATADAGHFFNSASVAAAPERVSRPKIGSGAPVAEARSSRSSFASAASSGSPPSVVGLMAAALGLAAGGGPVADPPVAAGATADWLEGEAAQEEEVHLSRGSAQHASGQCTPCKFFRGHRGCRDGGACSLCHHPHEELTYSAIRRGLKKRAIEKQQLMDTLAEGLPQSTAESYIGNAVALPPPAPSPIPDDPVSIPLKSLSAKYIMSF